MKGTRGRHPRATVAPDLSACARLHRGRRGGTIQFRRHPAALFRSREPGASRAKCERNSPGGNEHAENESDATRVSEVGSPGRRGPGRADDRSGEPCWARTGPSRPARRSSAGGIGIQGRGMGDLQWIMGKPDVQFVAICDLQKKQRLAVKNYVDSQYGNQDCQMYPEIRGFLAERTDIDAVLIATGDRWHAMASILAMRAGQGRLHREALLHDDRRGPGGGRDGPPLRPRLPDRHAAAERGQPRLRHRDGPHRPAGQDPHRLRPHRPLGRRRDAPRLAAGRRRAAQGRGGLGRLAGPLPVAALQPQLRRRRLAGPLRLPHQLHRRVGRAHLRPGPGRPGLRRDLARRVRVRRTTTPATAWSPTSPTA